MELYFKLDQTKVHAGGELSGWLIFKSTNPIPSTRLDLYFTGEKCIRTIRTQRTSSGFERIPSFRNEKLIRIVIPVPNHEAIVCNHRTVPGAHEIPFRIQLPSFLPSSNSNGNGTSIKYYIRVKLLKSGRWHDINLAQQVLVLGARTEHPSVTLATVRTEHARVPLATTRTEEPWEPVAIPISENSPIHDGIPMATAEPIYEYDN
jgi:hypothetical protein